MRILWVPHAPWHVPQREKYLLTYLGRHHSVYSTDWDTDFRRLRDYASRRYWRSFFPAASKEDGITVYHIPRIGPALFSRGLRAFNSRVYQEWIARVIERHHIDWLIASFVVPYVDFGIPTSIDIGDDNVAYWSESGGPQLYGREIAENELAWIRESRGVTVVSSVLRERLQRRVGPSKPFTVIPNGVDLDVFQPPLDKGRVKADLDLNPHFRYMSCIGSFNRHGEIERLLAVARRIQPLSYVRLVVVGRGKYIPLLQKRLAQEGLTGVIFAGFQQGDKLLRYFQATDVGLCPYPLTYGLHASSPLRLLQYSAVGAAVVIPPLQEVVRMRFGNVLLSGESDDSFADAALASLDSPGGVPNNLGEYHWKRLAHRMEQCF